MTGSAPTGVPATPFLSVVVPADAARPQAVRETLLALFGQADDDFEVVLVAATRDETERAVIEHIVADQPPFVARRLRVLHQRPQATPGAIRNLGLESAVGRYVTVLPAGDMVLGSWVQTFHRGATAASAGVLRARGLVQAHTHVRVLDQDAVRAAGSPRADAAGSFSLLQHALEPSTPAGSWAWPRSLEDGSEARFDEDIVDDPDRELLVRLAEAIGVVDLGTVTLIKREWSPPTAVAARSGVLAQDVIDNRPLLLPAGETRALAAGLPEPESAVALREEIARISEELRLTRDHADNLQAVADSLKQKNAELAERHAAKVARLKEKLAAARASAEAPQPAEDHPPRAPRRWLNRDS